MWDSYFATQSEQLQNPYQCDGLDYVSTNKKYKTTELVHLEMYDGLEPRQGSARDKRPSDSDGPSWRCGRIPASCGCPFVQMTAVTFVRKVCVTFVKLVTER